MAGDRLRLVARRAARSTVAFFAVLGAISIAGMAYQAIADHRATSALQPPGRLVDVGGRKMHLACAGAGSPTVILEAGGLGGADQWRAVQPPLAALTRTCAYDRLGVGFSARARGERDGARLADELHQLLARAGEKPPYLMVGHSVGGRVVRLYAAAHPDEVRGLVLVDSPPDGLLASLPRTAARMRRAARLGRVLVRLGFLRLADPFHLDGTPAFALTYRGAFFDTVDGILDAWARTDEELLAAPPPPDLPTVVITHGRPGDFAGPDMIDPAEAEAAERVWQAGERALAARSTRGRLVVAERSGHAVPLEQPELIIEAVRNLLAPR